MRLRSIADISRTSALVLCLAVASAMAAGVLSSCAYISIHEDKPPVSVKVFRSNVGDAPVPAPDISSVAAEDTSYHLTDTYHREHLSVDEIAVYDALKEGFTSLSNDIDIPDCSADTAQKCYQYVLADIPEMFWVDTSYQYMIQPETKTVVSIQPTYTYTAADASVKKAEVERRRDEILSLIPATAATDYDKAKFLFSWITENLVYDENMAERQDLATVFSLGSTACGGYSKAFQYLCRGAGIDCVYLTGYAEDDNGEKILHAWNGIILDGVPCYVDATWGDKETKVPTDYAWLGLTYGSIAQSHELENEELALDNADDARYELWNLEHSAFDKYDKASVYARLFESVENNELVSTIKFTSEQDARLANEDIRGTSELATEIANRYPEKFPLAYTDGVYSIYYITGLNACKIVWKY